MKTKTYCSLVFLLASHSLIAHEHLLLTLLGTVYLCLKLICGYKKNHIEEEITGLLNQHKQKEDTNIVYITKNCNICILLITLRPTLKFKWIIRNAILKHSKQ